MRLSPAGDQYKERQTNQSITLEVTNAVHALEEAKLTMKHAKVAVALARENLHADERKYELGVRAGLFCSRCPTQLAQAELNVISGPG